MILRHIFNLSTGELAVRRNKAQIGQQTVGVFVDMGRNHDAVVVFGQIVDIIKRNICGINQQIRDGADDFVICIIELLFAENLLIVRNCHEMAVDIFVKGQSVFQIRKKADHMDFLGGGQLHPRKGGQAVSLRHSQDSGAVFA